MINKRRWPWIAQQNWQDILFLHKPVTYETLKPYVPYPLEIDMYNHQAWISIVLFRATGSRLRFMPSITSFPAFYQMNIRTYVRFGNEQGVYFFKIHANNPLVNMGGTIAGMPFTNAQLTIERVEDKFLFQANQLFNQPKSELALSYKPTSEDINMDKDLLPHFLTERYAVWMIRNNTIIKAPIFHTNWNLKHAHISVLHSTQMPFSITDDFIAHYAEFKHTLIHPYERIGKVSRD